MDSSTEKKAEPAKPPTWPADLGGADRPRGRRTPAAQQRSSTAAQLGHLAGRLR